MTFLPEDDREFLTGKGIAYEELTEKLPTGEERRGVHFPGLPLDGHLRSMNGAQQWVSSDRCDLLIVVPSGYSTTKLDSFYTSPRLKRADGTEPANATGEAELFNRKWQFWSRHLDDKDWRVGVDGMSTFLKYVQLALKTA